MNNSHSYYYDKVKEIEALLDDADHAGTTTDHPLDLWKLREACLSEGGLVHDALRKRVWPLLVGLSSSTTAASVEHATAGRTTGPIQEEEEGDEESSLSSPTNEHGSHKDQGGTSEPTPASSREHPPQDHAPQNDDRHDDNEEGENEDLHPTPHEDAVSCGDSATTLSRTNNPSLTTPRGGGSTNRQASTTWHCPDHYQIALDVARCTWHLLTGDQRAQRYQMEHKRNRQVARIIRRKQRRLGLFINLTLLLREDDIEKDNSTTTPSPTLRYYQGYHDVACIFLSTLAGGSTTLSSASSGMPTTSHASSSTSTTLPPLPPPALALPARVLHQVSQSHLRDYLKDNFVDLQTALRLTIFPLLAVLDRPVHDHLRMAEMEPFFCLSWIITWFCHDIRDTALCKRLFDVFLVSHPLLPLYMSIAMVVHPINRRLVLETEADFALVHQMLRGLPRNSSMVGWKYRPGDGYVSDDEEEDEEEDEAEVAAVEARLDAAVDGDIRQLKSVLDKDVRGVPTGATSSVSTGTYTADTTEAHARVPFQELIDLALRFLQAVPPRQLLPLAQRYYGKKHVKMLLEETNSIELLGEVPPWAIRPTLSTETSAKEILRVLRDKKRSKAVIALGLGLSDQERRRNRRRRFWIGVVAVALLAIAITWSDQRRIVQKVQQVIGFRPREAAPPSEGTCSSETPRKSGSGGASSPPRVGSAMKNSLLYNEATVTADGRVDPVLLNSQAQQMASSRLPPVMQTERRSSIKMDSSSSGKQGERPKWMDLPVIKWIRRIRLPKRNMFQRGPKHMISDGRKHPGRHTLRRLKPLRDFLQTPWEEIYREAKKIAWDQGRLLQRWLNHPTCFSSQCNNFHSGKRKIPL